MPFRKGHTPWWIIDGKPAPTTLPEVRKKISESHKGMIPWNKGVPRTIEVKRKISLAHKTNPSSGQFKNGHKINVGRKHTHQAIANMKESARRRNFIKHIIENSMIRPTSPEMKFMEICAKHHLPFRYTGDGQVWISNLNPDFVSVEGERIAVEIFGDYWHSPVLNPQVDYFRRYDERIKIFRKFGWKLVIIWQSELPNERLVLKKLESVKKDVEKMTEILR